MDKPLLRAMNTICREHWLKKPIRRAELSGMSLNQTAIYRESMEKLIKMRRKELMPTAFHTRQTAHCRQTFQILLVRLRP